MAAFTVVVLDRPLCIKRRVSSLYDVPIPTVFDAAVSTAETPPRPTPPYPVTDLKIKSSLNDSYPRVL